MAAYLVANVVNGPLGITLDKFPNRTVLPIGLQQLHFGVAKVNKCSVDAVFRLSLHVRIKISPSDLSPLASYLTLADGQAEDISIKGHVSAGVFGGNGNMVELSHTIPVAPRPVRG